MRVFVLNPHTGQQIEYHEGSYYIIHEDGTSSVYSDASRIDLIASYPAEWPIGSVSFPGVENEFENETIEQQAQRYRDIEALDAFQVKFGVTGATLEEIARLMYNVYGSKIFSRERKNETMTKIDEAMQTIKQEILNNPEFAERWRFVIATSCYNTLKDDGLVIDNISHEHIMKICNDVARKAMKHDFGIDIPDPECMIPAVERETENEFK